MSTSQASRGKAAPKGVSIKAIVKYLSQFCAITSDDISNPNPESTMDILWNILCHIYGEDKLLEGMRGKESKRLLLCLPIRVLLDKLIPNMQPGFTMTDLIYPTKERMGVIYSTLINYLKVLEEQSHIRDDIMKDQQELKRQEDEMKHQIVDVVEKCRVAEAKYQSNIETCSKLQDRFLTQETANNHLKTQAANYTLQVEKKKSILQEEKAKETQLNETIKKIDERIDYLDLNTQLPKAELEEKLNTMHREVDELKEEFESKRRLVKAFSKKLEDKESDRRMAKFAQNTLEETRNCLERNKKTVEDCEELILTLQSTFREAQLQLMECENELSSHKESYNAEKQSLELRVSEYQQSITEMEIAKDELEKSTDELTKSIAELESRIAGLKEQITAENKSWETVVSCERKAWQHLETVKSETRRNRRKGVLTNQDQNSASS